MLCRALLAAVAISYLVCVLLLSGIQKDDLDVALLKKLEEHNVDFKNMNNGITRQECLTNKQEHKKNKNGTVNQKYENLTIQKAKELVNDGINKSKLSITNGNIDSKDLANLMAVSEALELKYLKDENNTEGTTTEFTSELNTKRNVTVHKTEKFHKIVQRHSDDENQSTIIESIPKIEYNAGQPTIDSILNYWQRFNKKTDLPSTINVSQLRVPVREVRITHKVNDKTGPKRSTLDGVHDIVEPTNSEYTELLEHGDWKKFEDLSKKLQAIISLKKRLSTVRVPDLRSTRHPITNIEEQPTVYLKQLQKLLETITDINEKHNGFDVNFALNSRAPSTETVVETVVPVFVSDLPSQKQSEIQNTDYIKTMAQMFSDILYKNSISSMGPRITTPPNDLSLANNFHKQPINSYPIIDRSDGGYILNIPVIQNYQNEGTTERNTDRPERIENYNYRDKDVSKHSQVQNVPTGYTHNAIEQHEFHKNDKQRETFMIPGSSFNDNMNINFPQTVQVPSFPAFYSNNANERNSPKNDKQWEQKLNPDENFNRYRNNDFLQMRPMQNIPTLYTQNINNDYSLKNKKQLELAVNPEENVNGYGNKDFAQNNPVQNFPSVYNHNANERYTFENKKQLVALRNQEHNLNRYTNRQFVQNNQEQNFAPVHAHNTNDPENLRNKKLLETLGNPNESFSNREFAQMNSFPPVYVQNLSVRDSLKSGNQMEERFDSRQRDTFILYPTQNNTQINATSAKNYASTVLPQKMIKEIAESIKDLVMKDLKKEVTTSTTRIVPTTITTVSTSSTVLTSITKSTSTTITEKVSTESNSLDAGKVIRATDTLEKFMQLFERIKIMKEKGPDKDSTIHSTVVTEKIDSFNMIPKINRVDAVNTALRYIPPFLPPSPPLSPPSRQMALPILMPPPMMAPMNPYRLQESNFKMQPILSYPFQVKQPPFHMTQPLAPYKAISEANQQSGAVMVQTNRNVIPPIGVRVARPIEENNNIVVTTESSFINNKKPVDYLFGRNPTNVNRYRSYRNRWNSYSHPNLTQRIRASPEIYRQRYINDRINSRERDYEDHKYRYDSSSRDRDKLRHENEGRLRDMAKSDVYTSRERERPLSRKLDIRGFHERLERVDDSQYECEGSECNNPVVSRQVRPVNKRIRKYDDSHFKTFLETQQKVNDMLEQILGSKVEVENHQVDVL